MAYKIYRRGGYFYIVDTTDGREREGLINNVKVTRGGTNQNTFRIIGVDNWSHSKTIDISEIQDYDGIQYTLSGFITFYESNSTDVNTQDSTSDLFIVEASKLITETTITTATALDDYVINVASATSFVVEQYLTIYNETNNKVFFSKILAINTLAITLDSPLDYTFPIGSFVSVGDINMNVDGSVTPQIFGIRNPTATDIPLKVDIVRLMFKCLTATAIDLSKFGDIVGGLVRGLVVRKVDGTYKNVFNVKTNAGLKMLMYDFSIEVASNQQQDGFTGRFTMAKLGSVIRLSAGEYLQIVIQDDLTSLQQFNIAAEGSQVTN